MSPTNQKQVQGFDASDAERPFKPAGYVSTEDLKAAARPDLTIEREVFVGGFEFTTSTAADARAAFAFCDSAIGCLQFEDPHRNPRVAELIEKIRQAFEEAAR